MKRLLPILCALLLIGCEKKPVEFVPLDGTGTCYINAAAWVKAKEGAGRFPIGTAQVLFVRVHGWEQWHAMAIFPDGQNIGSWEFRDGFEVNYQLAQDRTFWHNARALAELWAANALPPTHFVLGAKFSTEGTWQ